MKLEGIEIKLAGKKYIMPELPYTAYEDHDAMIKIVDIARSLDAMHGNPLLHPFTGKTLKDSRELILLALNSNYDYLNEEEILKKLKVVDIVTAISILISKELEVQQMVEIDRKNVEPQAETEK